MCLTHPYIFAPVKHTSCLIKLTETLFVDFKIQIFIYSGKQIHFRPYNQCTLKASGIWQSYPPESGSHSSKITYGFNHLSWPKHPECANIGSFEVQVGPLKDLSKASTLTRASCCYLLLPGATAPTRLITQLAVRVQQVFSGREQSLKLTSFRQDVATVLGMGRVSNT